MNVREIVYLTVFIKYREDTRKPPKLPPILRMACSEQLKQSRYFFGVQLFSGLTTFGSEHTNMNANIFFNYMHNF